MKKISDFCTKYGINVINTFVLLIAFILIIYISFNFNTYQTKTLINNYSISANTTNQKMSNNNYNDFLAHYYETQSNWLNAWLTILGIVLAVAGVAIPLLLNASYINKIKEMERKFAKQKLSMIKEHKEHICNISNTEKKANKVLSQTEEQLEKIQNVYSQKQTNIVGKALSDTLTEINFYVSQAEIALKEDNKQNSVNYLTKAIDLCIISQINYPEHNDFQRKLVYLYGSRACNYMIINFYSSEKDYLKAIQMAEELNMIEFIRIDYAQLLGLYLIYQKYDLVISLFKTIQEDPNKKHIIKDDIKDWLNILTSHAETSITKRLKEDFTELMQIVPGKINSL